MQTWDLGKIPQFSFTLPDKKNENSEETDSNAETIPGSIQKGRKDLGKTLVSQKEMWKQWHTFSVTLQCVTNCF